MSDMTDYKKDYYRMIGKNNSLFKRFFNFLFRHNLRFAYWYRKMRSGSKIAKLALYRISRKYGIEVSNTAAIGEGLYLGHPYNITVGRDVVIGKNANLHKGVTVGNIMAGKRAGSPKIGNCVWIGVNATVVGGITIGDDVVIAPNSFVNFDVPSHSVVIGNPGEIHRKEDATENYILHRT